MRIFHIATAADWEAARASGRYTTSTYGVSLAEAGFVHASRADQWQQVRERFYGEVNEPLVLLVIETDRLTAPVVEEAVPGGETFPHVYGAVETAAVVQAVPLPAEQAAPGARGAPGRSFSSLYLEEVFHRLALAVIVMVAVALLAGLGDVVAPPWGALLGVGLGLLVGVPLAVAWHRRRERQLD